VKLKPPSLITASEYEHIIALWDAAGLKYRPGGRDSRAAIERQIAGGTHTFVGVQTEGGDLIGVVLVTHDGRKGWINRLVVHPDYRRQGIGKTLIAAAEKVLDEQGIGVIAALIEPGNDISLALFASAGYVDWPGMHYVSKRKSENI
jgi:GNAT superfamily N-acetyltransferase